MSLPHPESSGKVVSECNYTIAIGTTIVCSSLHSHLPQYTHCVLGQDIKCISGYESWFQTIVSHSWKQMKAQAPYTLCAGPHRKMALACELPGQLPDPSRGVFASGRHRFLGWFTSGDSVGLYKLLRNCFYIFKNLIYVFIYLLWWSWSAGGCNRTSCWSQFSLSIMWGLGD